MMKPEDFVFWGFGAIIVISAFGVVHSRSIVHAGFWLLPCFLGVAGIYAALQAHFFFVVQLLIYAGAIMVLMLFALMLTRNAADPQAPQHNRLRPAAAIACSAFVFGTGYLIAAQPWSVTAAQPAAPEAQARALGDALIGAFAAPFEVASLLLLAALIGAIVLAKADRGPELPEAPLADSVGSE